MTRLKQPVVFLLFSEVNNDAGSEALKRPQLGGNNLFATHPINWRAVSRD
jgi:hypothetical protein